MDLATAQTELRRAYVGGGIGAIVSGLVWLTAGVTHQTTNLATGFAVLFFGGMLIFPIGKLVMQVFYRRPAESKQNPGGLIVIETVFPMIGGLFAAWLLMPHRPEFVFPVAAISVGAHYFGFRTAYGDWSYWLFGGLLMAIGSASIIAGVPAGHLVPFLVFAIEMIFGIGYIVRDLRRTQTLAEETS